jgi:hypothetical protein
MAAALVLGGTQAALADAVVGTWEIADAQGDGPLINTNTNNPIVGEDPDDVSFNSGWANGEMIFSPFTEMTLDSAGDKVVFTGSVTLSSTNNSGMGDGAPRTQFRFGLFDGDTADELGWVGYLMTNKHGNAGTPAGSISRKNIGNTNAFLAVTGAGNATALVAVQGDGTEASRFNDGTYNMMMSIERNAAGALVINSSIVGVGNRVALRGDFNDDDFINAADYAIWKKGGPLENDDSPATVDATDYADWAGLFGGPALNQFSQIMTVTDTTGIGTFTFDRLGFLTGGNLGTDRAEYFNLDVTFTPGGAGSGGGSAVPEPATSILLAVAALAALGRRPRRSHRLWI